MIESDWLSGRSECSDCGSSRGLASKTDGTTYCHSCGVTHSPHGTPTPRSPRVSGLIPSENITYAAIPSRGINLAAAEHFRYGTCEHKGDSVHVAQWFDDSGQVYAQKVRTRNKDFFILGDAGRMGLFGAWKVPAHGKRIIITEGELDALAVSQVFGNNWPVVSLPNGASSAAKHIKSSLEMLDAYEEVVLCFDQDDAGAKAVAECLPLFPPGKLRIAKLPLKDACDMLKAQRGQELKEAVWNAKVHMPGGILTGDEAWEKAMNEKFEPGYPYEFQGIQEYLRGIRKKELILLTSGTGSGKSTFVRQLTAHIAKSGHKIGYMGLEESVRQTMLNIYGTELGIPCLPIAETLPVEALAEVHETFKDRIVYVDHFGSTDSTSLLSKIRFMVKGLDCDVIILDHISIAVSGMETNDERKSLDVLITGLRSLVEETGCTLYVISHLRKPREGSHEEGRAISLNDLRGTQALAQIPDIVIALERDQQDEDVEERNTVLCRILKNRPASRLGVACRLKYDGETGRLNEIPLEDVAAAFKDVDDEDFS